MPAYIARQLNVSNIIWVIFSFALGLRRVSGSISKIGIAQKISLDPSILLKTDKMVKTWYKI
jgi:hypothetical protein